MSQHKYLRLSNGDKIGLIGLGTNGIPLEQTTKLIEEAIDHGYRHVDSAWLYQNEEEVGQAINNKIKEQVIKREDIFITSKLWNIFHDPNDVRSACKDTLKRLNLDYIDLYLMHSPMGYKKFSKENYDQGAMDIGMASRSDLVEFPRYSDTDSPISSDIDYIDTWKAMEKLVDEGLVKNIGVSNFNHFQIERICKEGKIKPALLQIELHPYLTQVEMVDYCHKKAIAITAYSPFGSPARQWKPEGEKPITADPVITEIASNLGRSPFQVILRYLNQRNIIAIPKSATPKNIQANINVFDFVLTDQHMKRINDLNKNFRAVDWRWDLAHKYFPYDDNYTE